MFFYYLKIQIGIKKWTCSVCLCYFLVRQLFAIKCARTANIPNVAMWTQFFSLLAWLKGWQCRSVGSSVGPSFGSRTKYRIKYLRDWHEVFLHLIIVHRGPSRCWSLDFSCNPHHQVKLWWSVFFLYQDSPEKLMTFPSVIVMLCLQC